MTKRLVEMGIKLNEIKNRWEDDIIKYYRTRAKLNPVFEENTLGDLLRIFPDIPSFTMLEMDMKIKDLFTQEHIKEEVLGRRADN